MKSRKQVLILGEEVEEEEEAGEVGRPKAEEGKAARQRRKFIASSTIFLISDLDLF